jgi:hypothetical protein
MDPRSSLHLLEESVEDEAMVISSHDDFLASRANQGIRHLFAT